MIVGAAQIDTTPTKTVELSGFAARQQPMTGVLDPIFAKALYLSDGGEKLLWVHIDALALSAEFVSQFREWALREHHISHVLLSATHTHAAPALVPERLEAPGASMARDRQMPWRWREDGRARACR